MYSSQFTMYDIRCTVKKVVQNSLFILLIFITTQTFAQEPIEQDTINQLIIDSTKIYGTLVPTNRVDSIQIIMADSIKKTDSASIITTDKKVKRQKKVDTTHYSPKKAAIWATGFPGLGQIYMKKYWKLPIVYGVMGTVLYFVISNGQRLKEFNGYIRNVYDSVPNPSPYDQLDITELESYRNTYRKNVQLASFGTVIAWGLSIVDAVVDAHLHSFDISDKLTLKVKPQINYSNLTYYTGISVNLNFK